MFLIREKNNVLFSCWKEKIIWLGRKTIPSPLVLNGPPLRVNIFLMAYSIALHTSHTCTSYGTHHIQHIALHTSDCSHHAQHIQYLTPHTTHHIHITLRTLHTYTHTCTSYYTQHVKYIHIEPHTQHYTQHHTHHTCSTHTHTHTHTHTYHYIQHITHIELHTIQHKHSTMHIIIHTSYFTHHNMHTIYYKHRITNNIPHALLFLDGNKVIPEFRHFRICLRCTLSRNRSASIVLNTDISTYQTCPYTSS